MPIDKKRETLITLDEAAVRMDRSYRSVWEYARKGVDGIRLEVVPHGARDLRTSVEACDRFTAMLEARRVAKESKYDAPAPKPRKAASRG